MDDTDPLYFHTYVHDTKVWFGGQEDPWLQGVSRSLQ